MASVTAPASKMKSFCVITGAGRGIGRATAKALAKNFAADSILVLTDILPAELLDAQHEITECCPGVAVRAVPADLSSKATVSKVLDDITDGVTASEFERVILINNAASIWEITRLESEVGVSDIESLEQDWMLNVLSPLLLASHVLKTYPKRDGLRRIVVNISTVSAIKAFPRLGIYCIGRAAREMTSKVIAVEQPDVRVLNYDTGVGVDTTLWRHVASNAVGDFMKKFVREREEIGLLTPDQTASVLADIIEKDEFESGGRLVYSDVVEQK